jgi:hypothetical protein
MKQFIFAVLVLSACGSYKKDLQMMCDAPNQAQFANAEAADKATVLAKHISDHLSTSQGKELFGALGPMSPENKVKAIRAELDKNGIGECTLLEIWKAP